MNHIAIGERIKSAREHLHITQEDLAATIGCTPQHISAIERGIKTPKLDTFVRIANTLHISSDVLLQDVVDYPADPYARAFSLAVEALPDREKQRILMAVQVLAEHYSD